MPARAMWKAVLHLADLQLPVKLYAAVEDQAVHFRLLHDQDMVPIRQRMVDPRTDEEVPREEQHKGVEVEPDLFVLVHDEELAQLQPEPSREIRVEQFVEPAQINHQRYLRPYYLGPDGETEGDYFALAEAIERSGLEGVARWTMRNQSYTGALRSEGGYLMLVTLRPAGEVVDAEQLDPPAGRALDDREMKMAQQLISALEEEFDASQYADQYRERVLEFVQRKAKGQTVEPEQPAPPRKKTESLAGMLEMSLAGLKGDKRG